MKLRFPFSSKIIFSQVFLFVFFSIIFILPIFVKRPAGLSLTNGDEPHYLVMSYSILHDHDIDIVNNYKNGDYAPWYPVPYLTEHTFPLNHKKYALHQIGLSVYILPAFMIGGRNGVAIFLSLLTALSIVFSYKILQFFVNKKIALFTTFIAGLSVPIFIYSSLIYPETFLLFLIAWILNIILHPKFKLNLKNSALLIILMALIPPLHIKFLIIIGMMVSYITISQYKKNKLLQLILFDFLVGFFSSLYLIWMYFWFDGKFFEAMNFIAAKNKFLIEYIYSGLLGSLVDRESGILLFAPIYIYIFIGFYYFLKDISQLQIGVKNKKIVIISIILIQTIFVTMYPHIISGQNPAGRYFLPIFPLLLIILATSISKLWGYMIHRILISIMLTYSIVISVIFALNPILALPFSTESNLVNFVFKENAPLIHKYLPNLSKFDRVIPTSDIIKADMIFYGLMLLTFLHFVFNLKVDSPLTKKFKKKIRSFL